jgi:hypothetical protein
MWKNLVESVRPQTTIWRSHISRQVPKVTNTHSEYVKLITFLPQQLWHKFVSKVRYTYVSPFVMPVIPTIFT